MQSRKRVWLLFTAVIIAVFAMVGCIPGITPDTTPPEIKATINLSDTTINQGENLVVTVEVTAEDERSNLKNTQITLLMKRPDENGFTELDSITIPFEDNVQKDTKSKEFTILGENFDIGGDYNFKAKVNASDVKDNTHETPGEVTPKTGALHVIGAGPVAPEIEWLFTPEPRDGDILPEKFDFEIQATHPEAILGFLKVDIFFLEGADIGTLIRSFEVEDEGTQQLVLGEDDLEIDIGNSPSKQIKFIYTLKDNNGNTLKSGDRIITISKGEISYIFKETHLGTETSFENQPEAYGIPCIGNYALDADTKDLPTEVNPNYELPFGITTLTFRIFPNQALTGDIARVFIYGAPAVVFNTDLTQFGRGSTTTITDMGDGSYETSIRFANIDPDNAKYLALFIEGAEKPWYVWQISALNHSTSPIVDLKQFGLNEDFFEGKPIEAKLNLKDEELRSLRDLRIQFGNGDNKPYQYLEDIIKKFNTEIETHPEYAETRIGWPTDDSWKFAIRYHVKVTYEDFSETDEATRNIYLDPVPDPKTVYVISEPVFDGVIDPESESQIHTWHRFDADSGERLKNNPYSGKPLNCLYFFGITDRTNVKHNNPILITEDADLTVKIYPEIVVVNKNKPDEVLFVSDAALGAANNYIAQIGAYQNYQIIFTADNLNKDGKGTDWNPSEGKIFPIYEDNTSPQIKVTYGPSNEEIFFADRRPDPKSDPNIEHIAPPMFFADYIEVNSGQIIAMEATDDIALYDFAVLFTNEATEQTEWDWRNNLPGLLSPDYAIDMPMGFDFKYWKTDPEGHLNYFYTGEDEGDKNKEDKPTKTLNEILDWEPIVESKALYTDIYPDVNPDPMVKAGEFLIDEDLELYENYTWSGVRKVKDENTINVNKQEEYFTMTKTTSTQEIKMPSLPGTYWVWIIARDRGAQDSWLFDYENEWVNIDPKTGQPEIYPQNIWYHQNNRFTNNITLDNYDVYYENSYSESDAPMVVLLRVTVNSPCNNIRRLDIHEPCLVSYPDEDDEENEIWYAHSYNVLSEGGDAKKGEFNEDEKWKYLPKDMYPVYKKQSIDWDKGNRFGVTDNLTPSERNHWEAVETYNYGSYDTLTSTQTFEAVPVVGGDSATKFRVTTLRTGVDRIEFELLDEAIWTEEQYYSEEFNILSTKEIIYDKNSDGEGKDGYWVWEVPLKNSGYFGPNVEQYGTIVVKAYGCTGGGCYEQWQWPIFVDTKGPEIKMFATSDATPQSEGPVDYFDHLEIGHLVRDKDSYCCCTSVEEWISFQVKDAGGLMFEYNKDYNYSELGNVDDDRVDRAIDLCDDDDGGVCGDYVGHRLQLWDTAGKLVGNVFHDEAITVPANYIYYGFPGTYPNTTKIPTPTSPSTPVSSLKYLTEEIVENEDLEFADKFHDYYTNTVWGNYYGDNLKVDPRIIPTIAFFNNIKLDWAPEPGQKTNINFEIRDELGNTGYWIGCVQNEPSPELSATVTATNTHCREATITVDASLNLEEIVKLYITEMENDPIEPVRGITKSKDNNPTTSSTTTTFKASEFLMPAFATERKFKVEVDTTGGKYLTKTLTADATYAGATVTVGVNPIGNIRNINQELEDAGLTDLKKQLYDSSLGERYYVEGVKGLESATMLVTVNFTAKDDNVDKYYISHGATICSGISTTPVALNAAEATHVLNMRNEATNVKEDVEITKGATFGSIVGAIAGIDCPESSPTWDASETIKIWYQDLDTYILSVDASPAGATESVTEIVVELQSDLLYQGLDDLKNIFTLERASDGSELMIEGASACNNIIGTDTDWESITTSTGARRNQKFWFKVGSFNLGSPRATGDPIPLEKTENGITCKMWDFWAPAIGHYEEVE